MKNIISLFVVFVLASAISSCSKDNDELQKWEYKTLAARVTEVNDFWANYIAVPQAEMDTLGAQGWELVDVYTKIETVHPNFGNKQYVTGLQPNTRTQGVYYVFKRKVLSKKQKEVVIKEELLEDTVAVVVDTLASD
ncbi:MAG: hypothetical protein K2H48_04720 [Duncaniella sp.]|nr:hypothetical protein [Duncaniella sp.]